MIDHTDLFKVSHTLYTLCVRYIWIIQKSRPKVEKMTTIAHIHNLEISLNCRSISPRDLVFHLSLEVYN
jgi:hypothetical protein